MRLRRGDQQRDAPELGDELAEGLELLAGELVADTGDAGHVPARARQACREPATDRVARRRHDNRDGTGRILRRLGRRRPLRRRTGWNCLPTTTPRRRERTRTGMGPW